MSIVRFDSLRSLGFASISGTYAAVGTPIQHNWRELEFVNNTDGDLIVSVDGINDNLIVPKMSIVTRDIAANGDTNTGATALVFELFTQFWVKQSSAPTSGSFYVQGIYARGE